MLNREPMGMKRWQRPAGKTLVRVSVLNREPMGMKLVLFEVEVIRLQPVSVLNREPMGMKPNATQPRWPIHLCFSAQPRADGDEAPPQNRNTTCPSGFSAQPRADGDEANLAPDQEAHWFGFQCSTASRWG